MKLPSEKTTLFSWIVIVNILLHPILQIYSFAGSITFDNITDLCLFVYAIIFKNVFDKIPQCILIYFAYAYLISVLSFNSILSFFPFGLILNFFTLSTCFTVENKGSFYRGYDKIGKIILSFFLLQNAVYFAFGHQISGIFNFLNVAIADDATQWLEHHNAQTRFSSFFSEPAHLAQFLLPWLIIVLFKNSKEKKKLLLASIIVLSLLLTQSGNAMFGLVIVFAMFVKNSLLNHINAQKFLLIILLSIVGIVGIGYYVSTEMGNAVLERGMEIQNHDGIGSTYMRLFRGYGIYFHMSVINQLFGIGDKSEFLELFNRVSSFIFIGDNDTYLNGLSAVLIHCGLLGLFLYIRIIMYMWKNNSEFGKTCLLLLTVLMVISSTYLNSNVALLLYIAFQEKRAKLQHPIV